MNNQFNQGLNALSHSIMPAFGHAIPLPPRSLPCRKNEIGPCVCVCVCVCGHCPQAFVKSKLWAPSPSWQATSDLGCWLQRLHQVPCPALLKRILSPPLTSNAVCVCERERERTKEKRLDKISIGLKFFKLNYLNQIQPTTQEGNGNPLQCSCLENSMDRGAWWATVHGAAKSWTRLSN